MIFLILFFLNFANAAELSPGDSAAYTKLVGADSLGNFTYYVNATSGGALVVDGAATSIGRTWTLSNATDSVTSYQGGTWSYGRTWNLSSGSDSVSSTQSGSWNLNNITGTISLPTDAAKETKQDDEISKLNDIYVSTTSINGTLSSFAATNDTHLTTIEGLLAAPISVSSAQSGTWNINNISGVISLPTGASTAVNQTTANASLSSIDGKLTTTSNGLKVDGSAVIQPVSASSLPLPTGAATAANQSTANTTLLTIDSDLLSFKSANHSDLATLNITLGSPFQAGGSIGNTAFTANAGTNLNTSALATSTNLTAGTAKFQQVDGSGNVAPSGDTIGRAVFQKITDGTNTAAVKAASTAPVAADPAIVVTLSPNSAVASTPRTWSYRHVAGAATTTAKSGAGILHAVCQNSQQGTTTVYDNTAGSGTVIAVINAAGTPNCLTYDANFATGLTLVTTNGANDITATYQ